ncbi:MAG: hypothetical protein ABJC60_04110 [Actinomycetota bacterium]
MRKIVPSVGVAAGIWTLASPWLYRGSPMGGMMHTSAAVVVNSSTYYWHIVPGAFAILLSVLLLLRGMLAVTRWISGALLIVAGWTTLGPWVLPRFGLGDMMNMGLTFGSVVRHVIPGVVLAACAVAAYFMLPKAEATTPLHAGAEVGSQKA